MLHLITKLRDYHKQELLDQSRQYLASWEEEGNPQINGYYCELNNEDESELVLYRCTCGEYIADYVDYTGRELEADRCHFCGRHYDYTEKELKEL